MTPEERRRDSYLQREYNITLAEFEELREALGNRCPVCENEFVKTPHVDHDHVGMFVRGLVCGYCNRIVIGRHRFPKKLANAAKYLETPPAVAVIGLRTVPPRKPKRRKGKRGA